MKKSLLYLLLVPLLCSCHVGRFVIYNFADIRDYRKFPHLPVTTAPGPFIFAPAPATSTLKLPKDIPLKKRHYDFEGMLRHTGTVAFLIIRNDSLLYEQYFSGYDKSRVVPSFSAAKSVVSALVGIAVDEGKIKSVQDPITDYLPDLDKKRFGNITIEHLLNMRSGIHYNESYLNPFGDVAKYYYGRNLRKYVRKQRIKEAPDQRFEYISLNTELLGMIVEHATGKSLAQYLQEKIWQPLGMEYNASWSVDSRKHKEVKAFCCLNARARDFARFGRLYLHEGNWEGKQLISKAWVRQSTTFTDTKNEFLYSYQWWHNRRYSVLSDSVKPAGLYVLKDIKANDGKTIKAIVQPGPDFFADGLLGQYIYVYPEKKMVIVRLGRKAGHMDWGSLFLALAENN